MTENSNKEKKEPLPGEIVSAKDRVAKSTERASVSLDAAAKYILLANAGGVVVCISVLQAMLGQEGHSIVSVLPPLTAYVFGMLASGLYMFSNTMKHINYARNYEATLRELIKEYGHDPGSPPSEFRQWGVPLTTWVSLHFWSERVSYLCFVVGSLVGLAELYALAW